MTALTMKSRPPPAESSAGVHSESPQHRAKIWLTVGKKNYHENTRAACSAVADTGCAQRAGSVAETFLAAVSALVGYQGDLVANLMAVQSFTNTADF